MFEHILVKNSLLLIQFLGTEMLKSCPCLMQMILGAFVSSILGGNGYELASEGTLAINF